MLICSSTDDGLSVGAIIGIIVGVGALVFLCFILRYYFICSRWERPTPVVHRVPIDATICEAPPYYQQRDGTVKADEPPPPYVVSPQRRLGGVYAPQSTYGAVN